MSQNYKSNIIICILFLISGICMICNGIIGIQTKITDRDQKLRDSIETLKIDIQKHEAIIDSLNKKLSFRESIIDSLLILRDKVKTEKIEKIEAVRKLPTTSGVEFLKQKLSEYEELYKDK